MLSFLCSGLSVQLLAPIMGNDDDSGLVSSVTFDGVADTVEGGKALVAGLVELDEATAGGRVDELRAAVMKLQDELGQVLETERVRNKKSVGVCQAICSVFSFMSESFGFLAGSYNYYRGQVLTIKWSQPAPCGIQGEEGCSCCSV
ncbi:hypothetical protein LSTR_LSTR016121 [Laodelphax striatellus]|uniref:Uncharacterized protein n=1 Tax=Laodelphax striatellus TaxID=195883 RepID=A0A482WUV4_LAOST|nr:hypothetical protein LSTR_LSTR016121 [Laodelphax striatellus]